MLYPAVFLPSFWPNRGSCRLRERISGGGHYLRRILPTCGTSAPASIGAVGFADLKSVLKLRFTGARFAASLPLVSFLLYRSVGFRKMYLISMYFGIRTRKIDEVELGMGNVSHRIRQTSTRAIGPSSKLSEPSL